MDEYLRPTEVMDYRHPDVRDLARYLAPGSDRAMIAKRCFEWVRDEISHSGDFRVNQPTCAASEVLRHKAGWCFAKSHLLAALLRANSIPAGLCYQRLVDVDSETNWALSRHGRAWPPSTGDRPGETLLKGGRGRRRGSWRAR